MNAAVDNIKSPIIFIPGIVNTNHRPRSRAFLNKVTRKWQGTVYPDPDYAKWQQDFGSLFRNQFVVPAVEQFRIYLLFRVPRFVAVYCKRANGNIFTQRRRYAADIDNLIKSVLDALNGIAYNDDKAAVPLPFPNVTDFNPWVEYVEAAEVGVSLQFEYQPIAVQVKMTLGANENGW